MAAAPPSIQQAALRGPVLEKAEAETTMDVVANMLAISLTVSHAPFLISAILVPCGVFFGCSSLLMSRAFALNNFATPYHSAALLVAMLPFASRKDIMLAMIIAASNLMFAHLPLAAIAIDSAAIIAAPAAEAKRHHYLLAATAIGLCASTDNELRMLLLFSYCALRAVVIFRRLVLS